MLRCLNELAVSVLSLVCVLFHGSLSFFLFHEMFILLV